MSELPESEPSLFSSDTLERVVEIFTKNYAVEAARIRPILVRFTEVSDSDRLNLTPLMEALALLGPETALELFEQDDFVTVINRTRVYEYLRRSSTPCYTLGELAELTQAAIRHLEDNADRLKAWGFPDRSFSRSPWLHRRLMKLYYVKMPVATQQQRPPMSQHQAELTRAIKGEHDDLLYEYSWATASDQDDHIRLRAYLDDTFVWMPGIGWDEEARLIAREGRPAEFCDYGHAPFLPTLTPEEVQRLEALREKVFDCKIDTLRRLSAALREHDAGSLRSDCFYILNKALPADEAEFLLQRDLKYAEFQRQIAKTAPQERLRSLLQGRPLGGQDTAAFATLIGGSHQSLGGVFDLLEIIGHYELELTQDIFNSVRTQMKPILDAERASSYLSLWDHPQRPNLDQAIDRFIHLQDDLYEFWQDYTTTFKQVLRTQFRGTVLILDEEYHPPLHLMEAFKQEIGQYARWQESYSVTRGMLAPPTPALSVGDPKYPAHTNLFIWDKNREEYVVVYKGRETRFRKLKGIDIIYKLLKRPGHEDNHSTLAPGTAKPSNSAISNINYALDVIQHKCPELYAHLNEYIKLTYNKPIKYSCLTTFWITDPLHPALSRTI